MSTTGQGELPPNARAFWRSLLRKKLPPDALDRVSFTIFGLGDRSYPQFNWAALKLFKRLMQLGADEFFPRGEADEQHEEGLDGSFVPWVFALRQHLLERFPLPNGVTPISDDNPVPAKWVLSLSAGSAIESHVPERNDKAAGAVPFNGTGGSENYGKLRGRKSVQSTSFGDEIEVRLEENIRVTPHQHWQDVRRMVFSSNTKASYDPGDILWIYPQNPTEIVNELITRMNWGDVADCLIRVELQKPAKGKVTSISPSFEFPSGSQMTLRCFLANHLDITAVPRRSFFSMIAMFTSDQDHRDRLIEFTKPEYLDELYDYTTRPRRSILEVLQEFDTVQIPWQWAISVFPRLRGRQFSIASGGKLKQGGSGCARFELLVAIVRYKTVIKKVREGVCTRYLANLSPGTRLSVTLQKGNLGIPKDPRQQVIMIGPGTGIAPIRSLLWERSLWAERNWLRSRDEDQRSISKLFETPDLLFFGNRNKDSDYFFEEEWKEVGQKIPLQVYTAFSRDQREKVYVQDCIRQQAKEVFELLHNRKAIIFVCGSSGKMPQAVRAALADTLHKQGNMDIQAAKRYVETLEKEGRYKQETW